MVKKLLNPATGEVIDLPAFPSVHAELGAQGMTLRDYFAAKAMQGLLAIGFDSANIEEDAAAAYMMADAMLKERAK